MENLRDNPKLQFSVTLSDIDCTSVVGLCEWEQIRLQPLNIDIAMGLPFDLQHQGRLDRSVDYTVIVKAVQFFCQYGQWLLLEDIAEGLTRWLLYPPHTSEQRSRIERVSLTIRKPDALGNAAVPAVTCAADAVGGAATFEEVFTLVETSCVVARRIALKAGKVWTKPPRYCLFVVAGVLDLSGASIVPGAIQGRTIEAREYRVLQDAVLLELQR